MMACFFHWKFLIELLQKILLIPILYEDAFNFFNVDAKRLAAGYRQERLRVGEASRREASRREERQGRSLREFGAASQRNGIRCRANFFSMYFPR
ncbi:hypothetical protein A6S26_09935 [Nostoc sp. ATCC 43529]|nr:hypothetical protein A6S26_09935 [Nostoc sp. ATCC 43529]